MALPILAGASIASGIISGAEKKRIEAHIQDRVATYSSFTNEKLLAIINTYGGEMGEAAKRVLATRPASSPTSTAVQAAQAAGAPAPAPIQAGFDPKMLLIVGAAALFIFFIARK